MGSSPSAPAAGECAGCHTVNGWKPSTFTVKEHASSAYPLQGGHARLECEQCHIPKGKDTLFKIKFERCTDCHADKHAAQFAAAPYFNACDRCHNLEGYKPSTFTLARHKDTQFRRLPGGTSRCPAATATRNRRSFKPKPGGDLPLAKPRVAPVATLTRTRASSKSGCCRRGPTALPPAAKPATPPSHGRSCRASITPRRRFRCWDAHRATACIDCHKPPNLETKLINADFKTAPTICEDCHEDAHGKQFAKARVTHCVECHNSMKWKPALFDHDQRTEFPLRGAHQNVRCADCHKLTRLVAGKTVLFYKPTPKECAACHGPSTPLPGAKPGQ